MGIIFFRGTVRATARRLIWMLLECKRLGTKRKKKRLQQVQGTADIYK